MKQKKDSRGRPRLIPQTELKKWQQEHGERFDDPKSIKYVQDLLQQGTIKNSEVVAGHLLYDSVLSRINACKYGIGIYKDIECEWVSPEVTMLDIIHFKNDMWREWIIQTLYFEQTNDKGNRPSIDRIDPEKGYSLDNIQMLSVANNAKKATAKPHYLFEVDISNLTGGSIAYYSCIKFNTRREALQHIGIDFISDTGRFYSVNGNVYLIQSDDVTEGKKEIEEYELDQKDWYSTYVPVAKIELNDGRVATLNQKIIFPQMTIKLIKVINEATRSSVSECKKDDLVNRL
ncbi:hypothetical protein [Paenibacillus silvisoli]|uniref:hypothetical protein n=1 Tax=Paenibacillus silvisoli TaxID=3110539 RepID=UPI002805A524|nr:hypothetical protein [Paenibacillus silvisoli]